MRYLAMVEIIWSIFIKILGSWKQWRIMVSIGPLERLGESVKFVRYFWVHKQVMKKKFLKGLFAKPRNAAALERTHQILRSVGGELNELN